MRATRLMSVVAIVLGVLSVPAPAHPAPAPATGPVPDASAHPGDDRRTLIGDTALPATRKGAAARIRAWPGKTIPYYESIPAKWDWSLDQAIEHWNHSGANITFVEVSKSKAKLVIGYGDTQGADGYATIGYQPRSFVHLNPSYKKSDDLDPELRVWVGRLFTHELGHVLGFEHTPGKCSLMVAIYDFGACQTLAPKHPGYYNCRWIDKKLLKRFIQMYGGKAKRPPTVCLIEDLPGLLGKVAFSGGNTQAKPVRITWVPPPTVRPGAKVVVGVRKAATCTPAPGFYDDSFDVDPRAGSWTDTTFGKGTYCYAVHIENRYGAARPTTAATVARYAPVPTAPAVGSPTWRPQDGGWRLTWSPPLSGTHLVALRDPDHPDQCVTTYDPASVEHLDQVTPTTWLLDALAPQECVNLFATTDWGTLSPPTQVTLSVPSAPSAPTPGPRTWDPDAVAFHFTWTPPDDFTSLVVMRDPDGHTTCPTAYDPDLAEALYEESPGSWQLPAYVASECASLFAVTPWGMVSPRTQIITQVPAPTATPVVGTVSAYAPDPSAASATVTLAPSASYTVGVEVVAGSCPAVPPVDSQWFDGYQDGTDQSRWYFYPEPYGDAGLQCVMVAAVDQFGQHGPVAKKPFTVAP